MLNSTKNKKEKVKSRFLSGNIQLPLILFLVLISTVQTFSQAPNWLWAKAMGGTGLNNGHSMALDASGNVYTTGAFMGTADFDPGAGVFNLTSAGIGDIFVSKLDSSGNFTWARRMGGTGNDGGYSITIDPAGNGDVYTTGTFVGTVDFDPGSGVFNLTSSGGGVFISKLDSSGNFVWAKAMYGTSGAIGNSIEIDPAGSGDVYTTGYFRGTVDFDPGAATFNLTSTGESDIFISKLDSSGNFVWAKAMGGTSFDDGSSIAIDPAGNGNVYTTGSFRDTVDFDPGVGVFNLTATGNYSDIFISKLDSSGNFVWAKAMGGTLGDNGYSITLDPTGSGEVYTTGSFYGTADFDPDAGTFNLTSAGQSDIFISKLNGSGNFAWAKAIGVTGYDYGTSITLDSAGSGEVYTLGDFAETVDFDPGAGTFNLTAAGNRDIFISKLDSAGNFVWAKAAGGTGYDYGYSIALNVSGNVHVAGYFDSPTLSFGFITLTNAGATDIFIAKLDTATIMTGNDAIESFDKGILVFPNPVTNHVTITLPNTNKKVKVVFTDITGKIIYTTSVTETQKIEVNTKDFVEGIYVVRIQATDFIETKKLMVVN